MTMDQKPRPNQVGYVNPQLQIFDCCVFITDNTVTVIRSGFDSLLTYLLMHSKLSVEDG